MCFRTSQRAIPREGSKLFMRDILIGAILGDGYLEPHGKGVRLQIKHSVRFRDYVEWKRKQLRQLKPSSIYHCEGKYPSLRFVTRSHPLLISLREKFYYDGTKHIPDDIGSLLNSPLSLAVWFMDDATIDKRQGSILFETQSFSRKEIEKLRQCLRDNFGIESSIHKSGRMRGLRLYIPVAQSKRLVEILKPFMVKSMRYKVCLPL